MPVPPAHIDDDDDDDDSEEDDEEENAGGDGGAREAPKTGEAATTGEQGGTERIIETTQGATDDGKKGGTMAEIEGSLTLDQMTHNALYYMLISMHNKMPVKRSDLIKNALNSQAKSFPEVEKKLTKILMYVFGMKLVKLEKGKDYMTVASKSPKVGRLDTGDDNETVDVDMDQDTEHERDDEEDRERGKQGGNKKGKKKGKGSNSANCSYILVSKFPSSVCDAVKKRNPVLDSKHTVLYLVLATIFMLNRSIDEGMEMESGWR